MTREEAIKKMQAVKAYMTSDNPIWGVTEMGEAFDMAIKALEEQPIRCKNCKHRRADTVYSYCEKLYRMGVSDIYCYMTSDDDFCSMAKRKEGEADADD